MSENGGYIDELIVKQLTNSIESGEQVELKAWLDESEDNQSYYRQMQHVWGASKDIMAFEHVDVENDFQMFATKVGFARQKTIGRRPLSFVRSIAAVLIPLIAIGVGVALYQTTPGFGKWVAMQSDSNIESIVLPDNTIVDLNSNSRVVYEKGLDGDERRITLEGEAFFNVAKNPNKPFIITIGQTEVKVLGTQFYLEEENIDGSTTLIVTEGHVLFSSGNEKVEVVKGEWAKYADGKITKASSLPLNNMAWRTGLISFEKANLDEVMKTVLDNFGDQLDSIENDSKPTDRLITTRFESPSLEDVLVELRIHFNKNFTLIGKKLIISD